MQTIHVLLGNCEGLLSDYLEALLNEVYGPCAVVQCTRTSWLEEFQRHCRTRSFDLLVLIPSNLRCEDGKTAALNRTAAVVGLIRSLKSRRSPPLLALAVANQRAYEEPLFLDAGVDLVLGLPFTAAAMKWAFRRLLCAPAVGETLSRRPWLCSWSPFATASSPLATS